MATIADDVSMTMETPEICMLDGTDNAEGDAVEGESLTPFQLLREVTLRERQQLPRDVTFGNVPPELQPEVSGAESSATTPLDIGVEGNEIPPEIRMIRQILVGDNDSEDEEVTNRINQMPSVLRAAPRGSVAEFLAAEHPESVAEETVDEKDVHDDDAAKRRKGLPIGSLERVGIDTWRYCGTRSIRRITDPLEDFKVLIRRITDPNKLTVLEEIYKADLVRELMPKDPFYSGAKFFAYPVSYTHLTLPTTPYV